MRGGVRPLGAPRTRRLRDGLHPLEAWEDTCRAPLGLQALADPERRTKRLGVLDGAAPLCRDERDRAVEIRRQERMVRSLLTDSPRRKVDHAMPTDEEVGLVVYEAYQNCRRTCYIQASPSRSFAVD